MKNDNLDYNFNKVIGKNLRQERLKKGYSLEELSEKLDNKVSRQALFKYESNKSRIKKNIFDEICKSLGIESREMYSRIMKDFYQLYGNNYTEGEKNEK